MWLFLFKRYKNIKKDGINMKKKKRYLENYKEGLRLLYKKKYLLYLMQLKKMQKEAARYKYAK